MPTRSQIPMLKTGQVLKGRWEIISHIATGGKGEVYLAKQLKLQREVALKIISQELIDSYGDDQEEVEAEIERFRREVLAMAKTSHPNVLQVYDFEEGRLTLGEDEVALDFIVMEYIDGDTLSATIPRDGLRGDEAALLDWIRRWFLPVLHGVEHIHGLGIIHRDLKPSNVLLAGDIPKITDFGLVGGDLFKPVTRSHHVIGTLAYMAPEQFVELGETDYRADIYSLGKILYNAVVGRLDKETMQPLQTARVPEANTPILKALDRIVQKATSQEPEKRQPSVARLRQELIEVVGDESQSPGQRRTLRLVIAASVALAGLLALAVWYHFASLPVPEPVTKTTIAEQTKNGVVAETIRGADGALSQLILDGQTVADSEAKKIAPFYLDETEVTNHQFVDFLNQVLGRINVVDGVARGDGRIWLHLGQLRPGYEPVEFIDGRFRIKAPKLAANPVVNVTALGAAAYARYYGRRLPSVDELLLAQTADGPAQRTGLHTAPQTADTGHGHMASPAPPQPAPQREKLFPVTHYPQNKYGVRGLSANASEWATLNTGQHVRYFGLHPDKPPVAHKPWEASGRIGFRCAKDAPASAQK